MHGEGHGCGLEDGTEDSTVADHEVLEVELAEEDNPVPEVGEGAQEDVELAVGGLVNLESARVVLDLFLGSAVAEDGHLVEDAAVEHVEHVHHDEGLEEEGLVEEAVCWVFLITNLLSQLSFVQVVLNSEHDGAGVHHEEHDKELVD